MANGHSPNKPAGQGDFGPVHSTPPKTSGVPSNTAPGKSVQKRGIAPKGIGGSKKSF